MALQRIDACRFASSSVDDTIAFGELVASLVEDGDVLVLTGGLGAGKTQFTKGLARGLGDERPVTSPTFALMNRYEGRIPVFHFDLYRLGSEEEVLDLGFDEIFFGGEGVCAVEWCEVAGPLFDGVPAVHVTLRGDLEERTILLEGIHGTLDTGRLVRNGIRFRDAG